MPGTPKPVVDPRFGPAWTPILQTAQANKQQAAALNSGAQSTNIIDQYGNVIVIQGQVNQIVTIGATHGQSGVQVGTGLPEIGDPRLPPCANANWVIQSQTFFGGAASTTAGSNTVTLTLDPSFGTLGDPVGLHIGAANVSDPSSGTPTPAITPGTTVTNLVSGTGTGPYVLTLSQNAAETGSGLYWAACFWKINN